MGVLRRQPVRYVSILVGAFVLIQLVPYGRDHQNPPVIREPEWNDPATRDLAKRACFTCHSDETTWPWYSDVAPISWLVERDVQDGRRHLNFSEWDRLQRHAKDSGDQVRRGEMPPWFYLPMHPEAKLTVAEKDRLIRGLSATPLPH
jgi:Haem-binding domain